MKALQIGSILLTAVVVAWIYGPGVIKGMQSAGWPLVEAKVMDARLVRSGGSRPTTHPVVTYAYTVAGRTYTSRQTTFHSLVFEVEAFIEAAPKGATVKVAVNPSDAAEAVLMPGFSWFDLGMIVLIWGVAVFGIVVVWKQPPRENKSK